MKNTPQTFGDLFTEEHLLPGLTLLHQMLELHAPRVLETEIMRFEGRGSMYYKYLLSNLQNIPLAIGEHAEIILQFLFCTAESAGCFVTTPQFINSVGFEPNSFDYCLGGVVHFATDWPSSRAPRWYSGTGPGGRD